MSWARFSAAACVARPATNVPDRPRVSIAPARPRLLQASLTVVGLTPRFKPLPDQRGVYSQPGSIVAGSNVLKFIAPQAAVAAAGGGR